MARLATAFLGGLLLCSFVTSGYAQDSQTGRFTDDSTVSTKSLMPSGGPTVLDTSRERILSWDPISIPSHKAPFSQQVTDLKVSIIEQKGNGNGKIVTMYAASGNFYNKTEDDKTYVDAIWRIDFKDTAGTIIDSFTFNLPRDHCTYHHVEPFQIPLRNSAFNLFDTIAYATATGTKPAGYEGGC